MRILKITICELVTVLPDSIGLYLYF
jgi:hypothetical protein